MKKAAFYVTVALLFLSMHFVQARTATAHTQHTQAVKIV